MIATAKPQSPTLSEALHKYQEVYLIGRNLAREGVDKELKAHPVSRL